jgi:DNA-binding GntR family transcriptional regulator
MPRGQAAAGRGRHKVPQTRRIYGEIKRRILDNEWPAGRQLLETELADLLGASRTPIREALILLARDGMVEVRPRHGMRVLPVSADDMQDIYDILTALESTAAEIVAGRGADALEIVRLDRAVADMSAALARDDLKAWAAADERFHRLLVELTRNRRLIALVNTYWEQSHRVRMLTLKLRPKPDHSNADHAALVEAIRQRNPERARKVHHDHRVRSGRMLVALLRSHGLTEV